MIEWTFKLAILGDGSGILISSYSHGSGLELLTAEVHLSAFFLLYYVFAGLGLFIFAL
jgi:hypothetical protein